MNRTLKQFKNIPFTHSSIMSLLSEYKNPNDKISQYLKNKDIIKIKRGLYILGDEYEQAISRELLANHIYGPSYVSMEYALSYHGLIPERVYEVSSITTRLSKEYNTELGVFSYIKSPVELYNVGVIFIIKDNYSFLIATKTKALCDKIIFSKKINITSKKDLSIYLNENLRIDLDDLSDISFREIDECIEANRKRKSLILLKALLDKG